MSQNEFDEFKRKRDRLERLISSAGKAAPQHWHKYLSDINEYIDQQNSEGVSHSIRRFYNEIKRWMLIKGVRLLMLVLALLMIIEIAHWCLMKWENRCVIEFEPCVINLDSPRFISCHKYLESTDLYCLGSRHESYSFCPGYIDAALEEFREV